MRPSDSTDLLVVDEPGRARRSNVPAAPAVSFEFFPPTDPAMELTLWRSIRRLESLSPRLVSVTCGADGSTRDRTLEVVKRIQAETALTVAPHITGIASTQDDLRALAQDYGTSGIRHFVALRGDRPAFAPESSGLSGVAVVRTLRSVADFEIAVAAYPEVHPMALSALHDIEELKRKLEVGATRAITQFFFDNTAFLRSRDTCACAGITAPIIPGILPINRFHQVCRFARRCGTVIPRWLADLFQGLDDDAETSRLLGAAVALEQVETLRRYGVREFHFYTLNRADLTYAACHALGVREQGSISTPKE